MKMAILFDEKTKVFYLHSKACTYAFGINELGIPEHVYFGGKTEEELKMGGFPKEGRCHPIRRKPGPGLGYDLCLVPQELHTPYGGDFYEPSLVVEYANGNRRSDFRYCGHDIFDEKPALPGLPSVREGQTLALYLEATGVRVTLF